MEVRETLRIATRSIRAHRLRSVLTVVGVVIGIASVVTFATFGASVEADILSDVGSTSVNKIYVLPTPASDDGSGPGFGGLTQPVFTTHDVQQLRAIKGVQEVIPRGTIRTNALTHGNDTISLARITATTGIAVIALVVGAIGIVNIMLVSVTERTREIGIMKAVGARNRDIMGLFFTEAIVLGGAGAIVGLPLGVVAGYGAAWYAGVPFTPAYEWFVIAIVVGILVGIIGGLYPAWRAAHVDPIDALRYE